MATLELALLTPFGSTIAAEHAQKALDLGLSEEDSSVERVEKLRELIRKSKEV